MDNPNLKRRVSILKKQTTNEESSPTESVTFKSKRKISFSGKNSIKEFRPGEHAITIWETSYEESANSSSSKANNQCGKNLFKDNSIQWNLYQDYEFKQNFIAQPILGTDDKENSMYNDIKHGRCKGTRPLQDKICEDGNMSSIYKTRQNQINAEDFSFKEFDKRLNFTLNRSEQNILGSSNVEVEDGSSITLEATEFDNIVKCLRKKSPRKRFGESSLAAENSYLNNTDIDMSVDKMNTTEGFLKIEMMIEKSASKSFGRMSMMHDKSENYNQQKTKFTDILNNNDFNLVQNENRETNIVNNTENSVSSKEFITLSSSTNKMKNYNNKKSGSDKIVENNTLGTTSNNTQIIDTNLDVCDFNSPDIYPKTGLKIMQSRKTIFYNEKIEEDVIPEKMELEKTYLSNIIVDKNQSKLIEKRKTIIFNQNCQMDNSFFECPTKLEKGKIRPTLLFNDEMEFCISPYKPQSVKKVVNDVELNSEQDTVYPNEGIVITGEQEKSRLNKYAENFELDAEQTNGHETLILDDEMGFDTLIPKPKTLNAPFLHIKSNNEQEAYSNAMEMDRERIVSSAEPSVLTNKNNTGKTKNFAAQNSNLEHSEINLDVSNSHIKPQKTKCRQTLFFNDEMEYDCPIYNSQKIEKTEFQVKPDYDLKPALTAFEVEIEKMFLNNQKSSDHQKTISNTSTENVRCKFDYNAKAKGTKTRQKLFLNDEMEIEYLAPNLPNLHTLEKSQSYMKSTNDLNIASSEVEMEIDKIALSSQHQVHYVECDNALPNLQNVGEIHKCIKSNEPIENDTPLNKIRTEIDTKLSEETLSINTVAPKVSEQQKIIFNIEEPSHETSDRLFKNLKNRIEKLDKDVHFSAFKLDVKSNTNEKRRTIFLNEEMEIDNLQPDPVEGDIKATCLNKNFHVNTIEGETKNPEQRKTIIFNNEKLLNSTGNIFSHGIKPRDENLNEHIDYCSSDFDTNSKSNRNRKTLYLNDEMELDVVQKNLQETEKAKMVPSINTFEGKEMLLEKNENLNDVINTSGKNNICNTGRNNFDEPNELADKRNGIYHEVSGSSCHRNTNPTNKYFTPEASASFPTVNCVSSNFKDLDNTEMMLHQLGNPSKYFSEKLHPTISLNGEDSNKMNKSKKSLSYLRKNEVSNFEKTNEKEFSQFKNVHKCTPPEAPFLKRSNKLHSISNKFEITQKDENIENKKKGGGTNEIEQNYISEKPEKETTLKLKCKEDEHFQKTLLYNKFNDLELTGIKALDYSIEASSINCQPEQLTKNQINFALMNEISNLINNEPNQVILKKEEGDIIRIENIDGDTKIQVFSPVHEQTNTSFLSNLPTPLLNEISKPIPVIKIASPNHAISSLNKPVAGSNNELFLSSKQISKSPRKEIYLRNSPMKTSETQENEIHHSEKSVKSYRRNLNFDEKQNDALNDCENFPEKTIKTAEDVLSKRKTITNNTNSSMRVSVLSANQFRSCFNENESFRDTIENTNLSLVQSSAENSCTSTANEKQELREISCEPKKDLFSYSFSCSRCRKCRFSIDATNFENFKLECNPIKPIDFSILDKFKNLPTIADVWHADEKRQIEKYSLNFTSIDNEKLDARSITETQIKNCFPFINNFEIQLKNKFPIINDFWKLKVRSFYNSNFIMLTHSKCPVFELVIECCPLNFEDYNKKFYKIVARASCIYSEDCWSPKDKLMYLELSKNFPSNESLYNKYSKLKHLPDCLKYFNALVTETVQKVQELIEVIILNEADLKHFENKVAIHKNHRYYSKEKQIKSKVIIIKISRIDELSIKNIAAPPMSDFTNFAIKELPIGIDFIKLILNDPMMYLV